MGPTGGTNPARIVKSVAFPEGLVPLIQRHLYNLRVMVRVKVRVRVRVRVRVLI